MDLYFPIRIVHAHNTYHIYSRISRFFQHQKCAGKSKFGLYSSPNFVCLFVCFLPLTVSIASGSQWPGLHGGPLPLGGGVAQRALYCCPALLLTACRLALLLLLLDCLQTGLLLLLLSVLLLALVAAAFLTLRCGWLLAERPCCCCLQTGFLLLLLSVLLLGLVAAAFLTLGLYSGQSVFLVFSGKVRYLGLYSDRLILEYIWYVHIIHPYSISRKRSKLNFHTLVTRSHELPKNVLEYQDF